MTIFEQHMSMIISLFLAADKKGLKHQTVLDHPLSWFSPTLHWWIGANWQHSDRQTERRLSSQRHRGKQSHHSNVHRWRVIWKDFDLICFYFQTLDRIIFKCEDDSLRVMILSSSRSALCFHYSDYSIVFRIHVKWDCKCRFHSEV